MHGLPPCACCPKLPVWFVALASETNLGARRHLLLQSCYMQSCPRRLGHVWWECSIGWQTSGLWCYSAGADLDPLQVLSALSPEMPLSTGVDILSHLLCVRLHRHRQGSIIRSLHKACSLSASVHRAEVLSSLPCATTVRRKCNPPWVYATSAWIMLGLSQ